MTSETITYNNKKVIKKTNSNGEVSYILRGLYLGIDEKTGKQVTTSITAKTLRQLDRKILTARVNFEKAGGTRKEDKRLSTFSELAEEWFNNYQVWVTSHNTINRVKGYVYNYIIPAFGDYIPEKSHLPIFKDGLTISPKKLEHRLNQGKNVLKKVVQKTLEQSLTNLVIFSILASHILD